MIAARRMLLLAPARSYRTADFMLAATKMGLDLTVASDGALPVGDRPVIPVRARRSGARRRTDRLPLRTRGRGCRR